MEYKDTKFIEERALYGMEDIKLNGCVFEKGESPLKECRNVKACECLFRYKYPFWYCDGVDLRLVTFFDMARAGVWYTKNYSMSDSIVEAPKNFRRCENITLSNVMIPNAQETLWNCTGVTLDRVNANGPYFGMNCRDVRVKSLNLIGDYSFDGGVNIEVEDSNLASKDAFWNCENVTVKNTFITGEYLGWNSKNLRFIDCTIESLQGMCYIENLEMINCRLINTTLVFEYADVEADIRGTVDSVFNPRSGTIKADRINHLVIQKDKIDTSKTKIICDDIAEMTDTPEGLW
ncbi:MAG: DUF3737 family protein [Lachnospiraceae bacterium]|nr:DUF3737 family protein [Lachnospiraceae bacterium]